MGGLKGIWWAWKGKAFGNQVADFLGVHRSIYHGAMQEGGCELHMIKLYLLKKEGCSLKEVGMHSTTFLLPGMRVLKDRFGPQLQIEESRKNVIAFIHAQAESDFAA